MRLKGIHPSVPMCISFTIRKIVTSGGLGLPLTYPFNLNYSACRFDSRQVSEVDKIARFALFPSKISKLLGYPRSTLQQHKFGRTSIPCLKRSTYRIQFSVKLCMLLLMSSSRTEDTELTASVQKPSSEQGVLI